MNETTPKKSLGQHWLHDQASLEAITAAADLNRDDTIVEIGPGTGTLTTELLKSGAQVIAIEYDPDLATQLRARFKPKSSSKLELHQADIRRFDLHQLPGGYKIVANIPYYLTAHLLRILTTTSNRPSKAVLLVQKEVAERVTAQPGHTSLVSIAVQYYYHVTLGINVPAELFTPPPKVDSKVLILTKYTEPLFSDVSEPRFFQIVKAGFSNRRKTLLNSLGAGLRLSREQTEAALQAANVSPQARAQTLSLDDWHRLYQQLTNT